MFEGESNEQPLKINVPEKKTEPGFEKEGEGKKSDQSPVVPDSPQQDPHDNPSSELSLVREQLAREGEDHREDSGTELQKQNLLSEEERSEIFDSTIASMQEIAKEHGVTLPENLASRLILLDEDTFLATIQKETTENNAESYRGYFYGTVLKNLGVVILNDTAITRLSKEKQRDKQEIYRQIGIHELWHSTDNSVWAPFSFQSDEFLEDAQKAGLPLGERPGIVYGFQSLVEGITDYRTRETLAKAGHPIRKLDLIFPGEVELVDMLAKQIGSDILYQAPTSIEGMRMFIQKIEDKYRGLEGIKVFPFFLNRIAYDLHFHMSEGNTGKVRYDDTKNFVLTRLK